MRSRTGCLTCRHRKLKCDERKPICSQCCRAARECVPSSGIVFRHQHNASMNGDYSGEENPLKGFYAYRNTFDDETIWLDIPKHVTFINTTNPYLDPCTPDFDSLSVASRDSPAPFDRRSHSSWPTSSSINTVTSSPGSTGPELHHPSGTSAPMRYTPELDALPFLDRSSRLLSPPTSSVATPVEAPLPYRSSHMYSFQDHSNSGTPPPIDPRLNSPFAPQPDRIPRSYSTVTKSPTSSPTSVDVTSDRDHEIAFLLRWFSEGPGYWMDLFDLGTYFSSYVPVKARDSPLLKYAAIAYAAKALARVQGRKPLMGGSLSRQARREQYPEWQSVDWYHKATQYYNTAVSLLLKALKSDRTSSGDSDSDAGESTQGPDSSSPKHRRKSSNTSFKSNNDELLAASAILCVYEFLDASVPEWAKHLSGAKSLLVIAKERMMPPQMPTPSFATTCADRGLISKARQATFWNIARQDMLAAFINKTHTRLDTDDFTLWKEAGLMIDDNGFILQSNTTESGYPEGDMMKEDLICNALVWLMSKLVNFMAAGDDIDASGHSWAGIPQRTLLEYWRTIKHQFQVWHDGLPITFKPCARVDPAQTVGRLAQGEHEALFPEVWYSIPMCASTMQSYHMSQIQLLMNKPHESTQGRTTVYARLSSYQSVLAACQAHSREIVGISLGRSDEAVRIHSVQPLFTAGQCLSDPKERQVVINLLRAIEADIGWATEYRVKQLIEQWQWEENDHSILSQAAQDVHQNYPTRDAHWSTSPTGAIPLAS